MDLVDQQQRRPAAGGDFVAGLFEHFADVLHAAGDRAELAEAAVGFLGQQAGERRLAGARRAVEDHRAKPPRLQHPPQQFAFAEEMLLADELGERRGRIRAASGWTCSRFAASDFGRRGRA